MEGISFDLNNKEMDLVNDIIARAFKRKEMRFVTDFLTLSMDITAVHCNDIKLDLEKLLKSEDAIFFHDIVGIITNINRNTGKLKNFFQPWCVVNNNNGH